MEAVGILSRTTHASVVSPGSFVYNVNNQCGELQGRSNQRFQDRRHTDNRCSTCVLRPDLDRLGGLSVTAGDVSCKLSRRGFRSTYRVLACGGLRGVGPRLGRCPNGRHDTGILGYRRRGPALHAVRRTYFGERPWLMGVEEEDGNQLKTASDENSLTSRERDILDLVHRGHTNPEIATELSVSLSTVKTHVGHILRKTGRNSRRDF